MGTMLDCKKVQPQLSEYVDGALDGDAAWSIKLHLATCAVCSRVESDIRGTAELLGRLPEMTPSSSFEAKLAARLADQVLQPRRPGLWSRLRDWWYDAPYARPMVGSAAALAALAPLLFLLPRTTVDQSNSKEIKVAAATNGSTLEQVWAEHASSDPFGDDSSLLLSATAQSGEGFGASDEPAHD